MWVFPTSSACWVLFSYRRAQSVCNKENRREARKSSNLQQKNLLKNLLKNLPKNLPRNQPGTISAFCSKIDIFNVSLQ